MSDEKSNKRKYELKKRADEMARTRDRIAEAAVELHGTVGPARTTMSAVARLAGVQRHTVYRYFPTEADLFGACSSRYFAGNPLPDPEPWRAIHDPQERLARVLDDLYAYYQRNERMFSRVLRDLDLVEALRPTVVPLQRYLAEAAEILAAGRGARGRRRQLLGAAALHALDFHTWRSLTADSAVDRAEAVRLMSALVEAAAASAPRAAARPARERKRRRAR